MGIGLKVLLGAGLNHEGVDLLEAVTYCNITTYATISYITGGDYIRHQLLLFTDRQHAYIR